MNKKLLPEYFRVQDMKVFLENHYPQNIQIITPSKIDPKTGFVEVYLALILV